VISEDEQFEERRLGWLMEHSWRCRNMMASCLDCKAHETNMGNRQLKAMDVEYSVVGMGELDLGARDER
jgi:hypothetical protein